MNIAVWPTVQTGRPGTSDRSLTGLELSVEDEKLHPTFWHSFHAFLQLLPHHGSSDLMTRSIQDAIARIGDPGEGSNGLWEKVVAQLIDGLEDISSKQEHPGLSQLLEELTQWLKQGEMRDGTPDVRDVSVRTHELQRIMSDFVALFGQLAETERLQVAKGVWPLLRELHPDGSGQRTPSVLKEGSFPHDVHVRVQGGPESRGETPKVHLLAGASPETTRASTKVPSGYLESGAGDKPSLNAHHSSLDRLAEAVANGRTTISPATVSRLSRLTETVVDVGGHVTTGKGSGELVEVQGQRAESGWQMQFASQSGIASQSHVANTNAATKPFVQLQQFSETLQQTVVRHLHVNPNGTSAVRLSLYPESLGQVDVRMTSHNGVLTAHLVVDTWVAKELLEGQLEHLRQALQQQGLQVDKLEVSVGQQGLASRRFHHPQDPHGGEGGHTPQLEGDHRANVLDTYSDMETAEVASWRYPHSSVNYTV